ncbi:MAG: hypothetical protein GDA55_07925 [Cellvibrionales bacterium]|nr:hypothetical protein [Cellvibrionales bacterium]
MNQAKCPITGLPAVYRNGFNTGIHYYSVDDTELSYGITREAREDKLPILKKEKVQLKLTKLAFWILQQNRRGIRNPVIYSADVDYLVNMPMPRLRDRMVSFMSSFRQATNGTLIKINAARFIPVWRIASCSFNDDDLASFIEQMTSLGYIDCKFSRTMSGVVFGNASLTFAGLQFLEELESKNALSKEVFLAMWFDSSMDILFRHLKEEFKRNTDMELVRIDKTEHNNKIDDEIIARLRSSRLVIADFTCADAGKAHRGGVYYEAGFAHGLNRHVIFTVREDCVKNLHFDTRQYNHIVWKQNESSELVVAGDENKPLGQAILERIQALGA